MCQLLLEPGFAGATQTDTHELRSPVLGRAAQQTAQVGLDSDDATTHDLVRRRAQ